MNRYDWLIASIDRQLERSNYVVEVTGSVPYDAIIAEYRARGYVVREEWDRITIFSAKEANV